MAGFHSVISSSFFSNGSWMLEIDDSNETKQFGLTPYSELFKETTCRFPKTFDEVAISDLYAETIKKEGLVTGFDNVGNRVVFYPPTIDDIIGKTLSNGLKIVGIFSPNDGMLDYLKPYINMNKQEVTQNTSIDSNYLQGIFNGFSLSKCFFLKSGFYKNAKTNENRIGYFVTLKGNFSSDYDFISSFNKGRRYVNIYNRFSGFVLLLNPFREYIAIILWCIVGMLLLASLILSFLFLKGGGKQIQPSLEKEGISVPKTAIIGVLQSLLIASMEFVTAVTALWIAILIINSKTHISLLSISPQAILLMALSLVSISLLAVLFSLKSNCSTR